MNQAQSYDAIVVGGSFAGMTAALQLARARRRVLVIDAGFNRNRMVRRSYGFLGQDGSSPDDFIHNARQQLLKYPNLEWLDEVIALKAEKQADCFTIFTDENKSYQALRLVLAIGIVDQLPDIAGIEDLWGKYLFHCPYCDGYEFNEDDIAVIGTGPESIGKALMLPDWGKVTLFCNHAVHPSPAELKQLQARGVTINDEPIEQIYVENNRLIIRSTNQKTHAFKGAFLLPKTVLASPLAEQLGCDIGESLIGPFIMTDDSKQTTVKGVFACGDAARTTASISWAVGDGASAGIGAHQSMIFKDIFDQ